ncbi:hypothetical protein [Escherichia coli]|uniref:hypothetical protein n=1 Tax=Escherichia coli TaxID=562 RepID=UPI00130393A4|nr:hypothetical protein [Escherichia coli]
MRYLATLLLSLAVLITARDNNNVARYRNVSYTRLTLPTTPSVSLLVLAGS